MQKNQKENQVKNLKKKDREKFYEDLVKETVADFKERQNARKSIERNWELNLNFYSGNQYVKINGRGEVSDDEKNYYWQSREVYNHIAPIVETRLSKFSRVNPKFSIKPSSDDDEEVGASKISEKLITSLFNKPEVTDAIKKVTTWSEICGTGFYKIVWDNLGGKIIGEYDEERVYEGEVKIIPVSPFEIFPSDLCAENIEDCFSVIHAKRMSVIDIKDKYGVTVMPESIEKFDFTLNGSGNGAREKGEQDSFEALVIEKYEKPSETFPYGRLITVAGDKLLYYGDLPYKNGEGEERTFPFVKQECITSVGRFFGLSIVDRIIPIQRAYNAVKNRKHEFMNRLTSGVMVVEDGSIDVDDLESEGLPPGKVLVYRQGAKEPEMMTGLNMPEDFEKEERRLLNEFVVISGVSDVSSESISASLKSGSALEILVEQENEKLLLPVERIRNSYISIAKQALRLYSEFVSGIKAIRYQDENGKVKVCYFDGSLSVSDDVSIQSENELLYTESQRKEIIIRLYESGVLTDAEGKISQPTKEKVLYLLGYKDLDPNKGVSRLQEIKAVNENLTIKTKGLSVEEIDDHEIHIHEHTRYVLSEYNDLRKEEKERIFNHIREHKDKKAESQIIREEK